MRKYDMLCVQPRAATAGSMPAGVFAVLWHAVLCHAVLPLPSTLSVPCWSTAGQERAGKGGRVQEPSRTGVVCLLVSACCRQLLLTACCVFGGWEVRKIVAVTNVLAGNGCLEAFF